MKTKPATVEFSPYRTSPEWLVVMRNNSGKTIFTAGYAAKHVAQRAAASLNRACWLVAA
jgi:hypothetical protein